MCYWWFVGDGYNTNDNVYLCTDSFDRESINLVNEKLKKLEQLKRRAQELKKDVDYYNALQLALVSPR